MKNEWNLFEAISRALAAGQQLVTIRHNTPLVRPDDGSYGLAVDEQGEEYELGPDFLEAFQVCIRDQRISWSMKRRNEFYRYLKFGPGVNAQPAPTPPGTVVDLLDPNVNLADYFPESDESDEGEEWKRLLE